VHLVFVSTADAAGSATHPRVLILAERDSEGSVIETHCGLGDTPYWTNAVTEIVAADNARVDHYRLQQESLSAFHTSLVEIHQGRDSNVTTHSVSFGGGLVRNDVEVVLEGENCECTMNGLYAVNGRQHVDNRTCVDHTKPHCSSHQLYKGILDGHSRGVFGGKIIVRPDAQKTDAYQSNKNLLLSENAEINTKPQLEIDANDVKCSHGATIGQIDEEAAFYLRSRGIGESAARSLLTYAFAADLLERMKFEPIRKRFEALLMTRLIQPEGN
jgi:Fe-S cluster assembly protein SufD